MISITKFPNVALKLSNMGKLFPPLNSFNGDCLLSNHELTCSLHHSFFLAFVFVLVKTIY